jgi:hypothetical protein
MLKRGAIAGWIGLAGLAAGLPGAARATPPAILPPNSPTPTVATPTMAPPTIAPPAIAPPDSPTRTVPDSPQPPRLTRAAVMPAILALPALRPPLPPGAHLPPPIPLPPPAAPLPAPYPPAPYAPAPYPPAPYPPASSIPAPRALAPSGQSAAAWGSIAALRADMAAEVPGLLRLAPGRPALLTARAQAMLRATGTTIDAPQLVVVVDRNPAAETLALMAARPDGPWALIGAAHVSTGQAGRKDYYITPTGVFAHTGAILDFRAEGTFNEHHVRGLGLAGMRVWDFGWQWALKGWHTDGEGGDIRLQMHATDPALLESRLGRPASEGCIRVSSAMNRFLDRHGVLDADYERAAVDDIRYRALLKPDRRPSPLAGRLLVVVDTRAPADAPPTAASRPGP